MKLYPHQIEALDKTKNMNHVAYYLDMGLGKTFVGSEKMMQLGERVNLVICQKSKVNDWVEHFKTYYNCVVWDLTNKTDFKDFFDWGGTDFTHVAIINYELAWRRPELLKLQNFTLMLDESSLIQNKSAEQTKFVLKLSAANVILLSGTPTSGKYENLWTQCHLLGWGISEQLFEKQYINKYFDERLGIRLVDKKNPYKNVDRLKAKFRQYGSVFMKTNEVFDLPEQSFVNVKIKPSTDYKKFVKDSIITIDGVDLVGDTSLTKMLYERQLCSTYSADKLNAFLDLVNSTQDRLIVFYNFTGELDRMLPVVSNTGRAISIVNGATKDLRNYEECDNSITFVQYQAGAMGLNLQKSNKIIYYSPTLRCEHWMQSLKRIHRIGQTKPCFYYKLVCGIDSRIYGALERGVDFTDELFKKSED